MVWRKQPEMSPYDEGAWQAEIHITDWCNELPADQAQATIQDAGLKAFNMLSEVQADPDHVELLRGYLSKFD